MSGFFKKSRGRILQQSKTISATNPDLARPHSRPSLSGEQALEIGLLSRLCVTPYGDQSISRIGGDPHSNPIAEHAKGVCLSETQSCWQLISNRAMLLPYARGL